MKIPKFISNTPDGKHCVQASVGMVLSYFLPEKQFTLDDLERLTGFVEGKGAWEMEELLNYDKLGLKSKVIIHVSYEEFSKRGLSYLEEIYGPKITQWIKKNTGDIEVEKIRAGKVAKSGIHEFRVPTQDDVRHLLAAGWLVMVDVNSRRLNEQEGFEGHRVLIYQADREGVVMHDPGLPAAPRRRVDWARLEEAWADPNDDAKMLIAVTRP